MSKKVDINGFWEIKGNPLTKEGVFLYLGKQIDPGGEKWGLDQDRIYNVYRPKSEIADEKTMKSFEGLPFIDGHEMLGEGCTPTDYKNIAGSIYNIRMNGATMVGDFKIYSDDIKKQISHGKKQLSLGYRASFRKKPGVFEGKAYDFVQEGIVGNHVALVECGRCGSDVRIFDKAIVCDSLPLEITTMNKLEELKAILDGMDEQTLSKADELIRNIKTEDACAEDACAEDEKAKKEPPKEEAKDETAEKKDEEKKEEAKDEAEKKAAEDEAAKKAAEVKDEAIRKEACQNLREAIKLHDQLVPHIGEFCMDEMFTPADVAKYGCEKLKLNVNAGSELATLTGFLAGSKGATAKVTTMDSATPDSAAFDFKAAYLAK